MNATSPGSNDPWIPGRARWPNVVVEGRALDQYVLDRNLALGVLSAPLRADLYLAVGCFSDTPTAVQTFLGEYGGTIAGVARQFDPSPAFADEVTQRLAETLFVDRAKAGRRIGQYRATGPLGSWVRTAARRIALRMRKSETNEKLVSDELLISEVAAVCDQELALTKSHSAVAFRSALQKAIKNLEGRERTLMKLHLVAGLTTVQIAKSFHLSQSSVSRNIRSSARKILDEVKRDLRSSLGATSSDVDSLFELVQSQVDLTLSVVEELPLVQEELAKD
jgi:RNA polymerase sigma-70 factor (ECF subfamily)